ncbi:MAG: alanine racemase [Oligoflexia bacterium]
MAEVSEQALLSNFRKLTQLSSGQRLLPMLKADAYGHGAEWVATRLYGQKQLAGFGVATLPEGQMLRESLAARFGDSKRSVPIVVFSGALPWTDDCGDFCDRFQLTPVLSSLEDWKLFHRRGWSRRLRFELKFNTGMNRLGINLDALPVIRRDLIDLSRKGVSPAGILSHLAMAENPEHSLSVLQRSQFHSILSELKPILPSSVDFHLANSAAIFQLSRWGLSGLTDRVRPGLSLYGIAPQSGAAGARAQKLLTPVLSLSAPIVSVRKLAPGDQVGYGGRFVASKNMLIAILGMGYADGLPRLWGQSENGEAVALIGGIRAKWVGAISMDLSAIAVSGSGSKWLRSGKRVLLLGPGIDPWVQAKAAGTIPYELLTSLGARVQRMYGGS